MLFFIFLKYTSLTAIFAALTGHGNEVKNEISSMEKINAYLDAFNEKMERCSLVNLNITFISNSETKSILVLFSLSDSKFEDCFTYFKITLMNKNGVNASMVPFNYDENKVVNYTFQNVECGVYKLKILPCFTNLQCQNPPFGTMISADCIGLHPVPLRHEIHSRELEKKVLLIFAVVTVTLLIVIGLSYRKLAILKSKKEKKLGIEDGIQVSINEELISKSVQVFIINHYNNATIRRVELLKDFMSHCPNLEVILIEDGLAVSLITGSDWLNSMLSRTDVNDKVVKKIIIVDSVEEMEAEENEIENGTFYEAVKKLSCDWSRSLDDYDNLFVVHFNYSFKEQGQLPHFRLKELDYIVKRVRYCIPDHLILLCLNLISGTQCDTYVVEEELRNLLDEHDIRTLSNNV